MYFAPLVHYLPLMNLSRFSLVTIHLPPILTAVSLPALMYDSSVRRVTFSMVSISARVYTIILLFSSILSTPISSYSVRVFFYSHLLWRRRVVHAAYSFFMVCVCGYTQIALRNSPRDCRAPYPSTHTRTNRRRLSAFAACTRRIFPTVRRISAQIVA